MKVVGRGLLLLLLVLSVSRPCLADDPPLPAGLGSGTETSPALPPGLSGEDASSQSPPGLPPGLGGTSPPADTPPTDSSKPVSLPFGLMGFWETRAGHRIYQDHHEDDWAIAENRLQLEANHQWAGLRGTLVTDLVLDGLADDPEDADLEEGKGWLDLRQANVAFTPVTFMDVKIGRQILTWGTGDLLFINDLFPKDWRSFFIGRDTEYLKAPSDAAKVALFFPVGNLDVIYTPRFDADRYISGRRLSYYNSTLGRRAGEKAVVRTDRPNDWLEEDEIALRAYKNIQGYELALYYYRGYWKSPAGQSLNGRATFPEQEVTGASVRGVLAGGIGNFELGRKRSADDTAGDDPLVKNSEWRFLLGYEKDLPAIASDLTLGVQYYLEKMDDYRDYQASLPAGVPERDEHRQVVTLRLTKLMLQQSLTLSVFAYYGLTDADAYIRPRVSYKLTDQWEIGGGANIFDGRHDHTFFGQFEQNSNVYLMVRYGF